MKSANVRLADLTTYTECLKAIDLIENDPANIIGGTAAWASGRQTSLKDAAVKKIEAIQRKADALSEGMEA